MLSSSCGQCWACKYRTKDAYTDCRFGSRCTRKDCMYAHASPAGTEHRAGDVPTACRSGIMCKSARCKFVHPSKSLVCTAATATTAVAPKLIDYIVDKLKKSKKSPTDSIMASVLGGEIRKKRGLDGATR